MTVWPVLGSVMCADDGLFLHDQTQVLERVSEAACGGWFLNMNPKRPSVVGLWVTRSIPRNSAPWGGIAGSGSGRRRCHPGRHPGCSGRCPQRGRRLSPSEKGDG